MSDGAADGAAPVPAQPSPGILDLAEHERLVAVVTAASTHGSAALKRLWDDLVAAYGVDSASRVWQEALSSSDVGQT